MQKQILIAKIVIVAMGIIMMYPIAQSLVEKAFAEELTFGESLSIACERSVAVAACEGYWVQGSLAQRNNNPGNLKKSGFPKDKYGHSIFKSTMVGWANLVTLLYKYSDSSLWSISRWYAGDSDNWLRCVTSKLG